MSDYYKGNKKVLDEDEVLTLIKQYSRTPAGTIIASLAVTVPDGWLLCDGSQVPLSDYYDLWIALGQPATTAVLSPPTTGGSNLGENSYELGYLDSASEINVASTVADSTDTDNTTSDATVYMFELPDLRNRFLQGAGNTTLGTAVEAGLPNITGWGGSVDALEGRFSGAFYQGGTKVTGESAPSGTYYPFLFDASRSNSIYGASNTVQPPSIVVNWLIKT